MLFKNGVIEETGLAAGVLNHPATGVAWLANKIAPHDEQLNAGDVVLAGSFTRPTTAVAGDTFHADYGPLGPSRSVSSGSCLASTLWRRRSRPSRSSGWGWSRRAAHHLQDATPLTVGQEWSGYAVQPATLCAD